MADAPLTVIVEFAAVEVPPTKLIKAWLPAV